MFLGIDVGTSEVKVVLVDEAGRVLAGAGEPLALSRPQPRWSEQSPEAWWEATLAAIDRLRGSHAKQLAAVRGIGPSGQMHGATLLDAADRPLRPAILWNDVRSDRPSRLTGSPAQAEPRATGTTSAVWPAGGSGGRRGGADDPSRT